MRLFDLRRPPCFGSLVVFDCLTPGSRGGQHRGRGPNNPGLNNLDDPINPDPNNPDPRPHPYPNKSRSQSKP